MRADRLISILMYLQQEGRMTAAELARRLEVSERTIYRDMDALSASGVPVYSDAGVGGGFSLPSEYRTRIDGLTTPEIHALFLQIADRPLRRLGIGSSLRTALLKPLNGLPDQSRPAAGWIQNRVYLDTDTWHPQREKVEFIGKVQLAVWEEKQAAMSYIDRTGKELELEIKPYGLVAKAGIWFLVAGTGEYTEAYRLSRIRSFEILEERFLRPEGFDLKAFWGDWLIRYEAKQMRYSVILEVAEEGLPFLAQIMGESVRQKAEDDLARPGWTRLTLSFENEEIAHDRLLALGLQAKVIEPPELRESIHDYASKVVEWYSG
ncbi:YafY family transcriptional regulator [Paenibacillus sp. P26]|nr:YafY family transcriptional regulator [Paenibacillus sp. P26]